MGRLALLLLLFASLLYAANPKVYAPVGDPVYNDAAALKKLSRLKMFRTEKKNIERFVAEVNRIKKTGFELEHTKDKESAKNYLQHLRTLSKENVRLTSVVKTKLRNTIKKEWPQTYRKILASGHSILKSDTELKREMQRYNAKLKKREDAARELSKKMLRTPKNLYGKWQTDAGLKQVWKFDGHSLLVHKEDGKGKQRLSGTWKIEADHFIFTITTITLLRPNQHPHTRHKRITRYFSLLSISKNSLKLKNIYDEVLNFTRAQK